MNQSLTLFFGIAAVVIFVSISAFKNFLANRHAKKMQALNEELEYLCREISKLSGPNLTTEHIPQRFPSKEAATAFGEKWSLGGQQGFCAKSVDASGFDEDHPKYDKTSISGGILYTYPAQFFGLKSLNINNQDQWLEFAAAKNRWLQNYLNYLSSSSRQ